MPKEPRKNVVSGVADRIDEGLKAAGVSQIQLARSMGKKNARGLEDNIAGKTSPGAAVLAALVKAGINVNWVLAGKGPKLLSDSSDQAPLMLNQNSVQYADRRVDLDTMTVVVTAVDELLGGSTPEQRANLIALTYSYMIAEGTTDAKVLTEFLRHWAKTSTSKPAPIDFESPEVRGGQKERRRLQEPVGDDDDRDNQGRAYARRHTDK